MGAPYRSERVQGRPGIWAGIWGGIWVTRCRAALLRAAPPVIKSVFLCAICLSLLMVRETPVAAGEAALNRIRIEYFNPPDQSLQPIYELVKQRQVLEKMQEIFSAFRLPSDLVFRMGSCNGVANAWYDRPAITVCYEYLREILQSAPKEPTAGVTPQDAVI